MTQLRGKAKRSSLRGRCFRSAFMVTIKRSCLKRNRANHVGVLSRHPLSLSPICDVSYLPFAQWTRHPLFSLNELPRTRNGGSVFHLQKVLGHSSLEMTRRYANLMTEDLQAVHEKVSLLSR